MIYDFDYYRIFYSAAKHKNITSAANELYLSQPTISRGIQKLEHELGCTLFIRTKQGVELTNEGKLLYQHVDAAFEHLEVAEDKLKQIKDLKHGSIHISATEMTMQYFLLPYLEKFKEDYPDIRIKLSLDLPETLLRHLKSGLIDLAVFTTPLSIDETATLTPLMEYEDFLIAGEGFRHLADKQQHLADLIQEPFILMQPGTSARNYIEQYFRDNQVTIRPEYDVSTMPMITPMVQSNMGIGFVPPFYAKDLLAQGMIYKIDLVEKLPPRQICLCTSNTYPQSAACKEFIRCLLS